MGASLIWYRYSQVSRYDEWLTLDQYGLLRVLLTNGKTVLPPANGGESSEAVVDIDKYTRVGRPPWVVMAFIDNPCAVISHQRLRLVCDNGLQRFFGKRAKEKQTTAIRIKEHLGTFDFIFQCTPPALQLRRGTVVDQPDAVCFDHR